MVSSFPQRFVLLIAILGLAASLCQLCASPPWLPFGPYGGDARRMALDPHDHTHLFLGAENGWIYDSHSGGGNWHRLALVGQRNDLVLDSIVVDPTDPLHLVVGAWVIDHPDGGIFISHDGGKTWINQAEMRGQSIRSLAESASDPKTFVAGSLQGVFRSTDGGGHWERISPVDSTEIHEVESVAIDPVNPNIIYAGTWHLPWKTVDGGEHWENIKDGIIDDSDVFSIIVDPKSPMTVYASACSGIYKSETAGRQFTKVQGIPSEARRTRVLFQDPQHPEVVFAGTTEGLFRTQDSGKVWTRTTSADIIVNDVSVDPDNSKKVLIATDRGGVLASEDGGDTFQPSNGGFSARQITSMKRDLLHPSFLYIGVVNDKEWGGVFVSDNGGLNWAQRSAGLNGRDVFSLGQSPDGAMFAGTAHGIFRLDPYTESWLEVDDGAGSRVASAAETQPVKALVEVRPSASVARNEFAQRTKRSAGNQTKRLAKPTRLIGPGKGARNSRGITPSSKLHARLVAGHGRVAGRNGPGRHVAIPRKMPQRKLSRKTAPAPTAPRVTAKVVIPEMFAASTPRTFDGSVYVLATAGQRMLAATSYGLLASGDNGMTWAPSSVDGSVDWRFLAAARQNAVAASLHSVQFSSDSGATWVPVKIPAELTRVGAVAVEPSGTIWLGGREGVFVSSDAGNTWTRPKDLYVSDVSSLFYDASDDRITLTSGGYSGYVFSVQLPQRTVSYADAGWNLRFARPVGDHLVGATLYDGVVVQPKMVVSPIQPAEAASR
jgi:photosystem II stability/assembly factor-like uncharacterized protein